MRGENRPEGRQRVFRSVRAVVCPSASAEQVPFVLMTPTKPINWQGSEELLYSGVDNYYLHPVTRTQQYAFSLHVGLSQRLL